MPRRAHTKSRYGCDNCRRRRVKCDEQGPPCTNCIARQLSDCIYSRVVRSTLVPKPQQHPTPVGNNYPNIQPLTGGSPTTPTSPLTGNPSAIDELELMHQFSTATYQSLCVSESETHTWQVLIPRLALKHRFLMNSILALASLHLATKYEGPEALAYIDAGLEHHSLSLEPFRITIDNITPDNCDAAFAQAVVTTAISLALPQLTAARGNAFRMIDNILMVFELLQGVKKILTIAKPWIKLELFSQGKFWKNELGDLDKDTEIALHQLTHINEAEGFQSDSSHPRVNREVISNLRHCFMKFACSPDPAPVLAWLAAVDKEFIDDLRRRESFPLLILAHWSILLNGLDEQRWWARGSGRMLISEVADELKSEEPLWNSGLEWVKSKVPVECGNSYGSSPVVTNGAN